MTASAHLSKQAGGAPVPTLFVREFCEATLATGRIGRGCREQVGQLLPQLGLLLGQGVGVAP